LKSGEDDNDTMIVANSICYDAHPHGAHGFQNISNHLQCKILPINRDIKAAAIPSSTHLKNISQNGNLPQVSG